MNLDDKVKDGNGVETGVTIRSLLVQLLWTAQEKDADTSVKIYKLWLKLPDLQSIGELGTEEKALLLAQAKKTEVFVAVIKGLLVSMLE